MAAFTGELNVAHNGRDLTLRLTLAGLARLQDKYGPDIAGLLDENRSDEEILPFGIMLDVISVSLQKGMRMPEDEAEELADDILSADPDVLGRLLSAAFPSAATKTGGRPSGKGRARR